MKNRWDLLEAFLNDALEKGVFPAASTCIWHRGRFIFYHYGGYAQLIPEKRELTQTTLFDLASLTKPLAAGLVTMWLVENKVIRLDDTLQKFLAAPSDKKDITIAQLLSHSAGFAAWRPYYVSWRGEKGLVFSGIILSQILTGKLEYPPGEGHIYSDLGFIVLGAVLERALRMSFSEAFYKVLERFEIPNLIFVRHERKVPQDVEFAATERCPWRKRVLVGEVHDENAWAMGGVSAHAGLFGTAKAVCQLGVRLLEIFLGAKGPLKTETVKQFWTYEGTGTHRLAWDSPAPKGSSAGDYFPPQAVGHTGFTGTSIWIDPMRELVVVLLTNRVHPSRKNEKILEFRPKFHNLLIKIIEGVR